MTPSARHEDIMKAGFVQCKNILVQCDKKLDSTSGILRIINIFNLLELSLKAQKMECKVKWVGPDGMSFVAETESGHAFVMDGAPEGGGRNLGPRPMETVLAGTGGCTARRRPTRGCARTRPATDPAGGAARTGPGTQAGPDSQRAPSLRAPSTP